MEEGEESGGDGGRPMLKETKHETFAAASQRQSLLPVFLVQPML